MSSSRLQSALLLVMMTMTIGMFAQELTIPKVPAAPVDFVSKPSPGPAGMQKFVDWPVDYSSGTMDIHVPLAEWKVGNFPISVSIDYHTGGIKYGQGSGQVGLGWNLTAGGCIIRELNGAPDEKYTEPRPYRNYAQEFDFLELSHRGNTDLGYDRYRYSVNGLSGVFYILDNRVVKMTEDGVSIEIIGGDHLANGFRITDMDGVEYLFDVIETHKRKITSNQVSAQPPSIYNEINFVSAWHLHKIVPTNNVDTIKFHYSRLEKENLISMSRSASGVTARNNNATLYSSHQFGPTVSNGYNNEPYLDSITCRTGKLIFSWEVDNSALLYHRSRVILNGVALHNYDGREIRRANLRYHLDHGHRYFLNEVEVFSDTTKIDGKIFDYNPLYGKRRDFFGNYSSRVAPVNGEEDAVLLGNGEWNPQIFPDNRSICSGMLNQIIDHNGTVTRLEYEPSKYSLDPPPEKDTIPMLYAPPLEFITDIGPKHPIEIPKEGLAFLQGDPDSTWANYWWQCPVVTGVRIKKITVTDERMQTERWREFHYRRSFPDVWPGWLAPWAFMEITGSVRVYDRSDLADSENAREVPFPSTVPYICNRFIALLDGSRLPGYRPENARVYYGTVTELQGGTNYPDKPVRTDYHYDLTPAIHEFKQEGFNLNQYISDDGMPRYVKVQDFKTYSVNGESTLFGEASHAQGYYQENIGGRPLLVRKEKSSYYAGSYKVIERTDYKYTKVREKMFVDGMYVENLTFARERTGIGAVYKFLDNKHLTNYLDPYYNDAFNWYSTSVKSQTWRCDTVLSSVFDQALPRTVTYVNKYNDHRQGKTDQVVNAGIRKLFGDTVSVAENYPLLQSQTAVCGPLKIEQHFLYGANLNDSTSGWLNGIAPARPLAQMWICGGDTIFTRSLYRNFNLKGDVKVLLPYEQTFGRPNKTTSRLYINSYSGFGHPTSVARDLDNATLYTWGYDGDCIIDVQRDNTALHTRYTHIPLVGCTSIRYPSGRIETFDYDAGRVVKRKNTAGITTNTWQYSMCGINFDDYNCITERNHFGTATDQFCETRNYFDTFGREWFSLVKNGCGDGRDLVRNLSEYDPFGRMTLRMVDFPTDETDPYFIWNYSRIDARNFYGDSIPYTSFVYSNVFHPQTFETPAGEDMSGHGDHSIIRLNNNTEPRLKCRSTSLLKPLGIVMVSECDPGTFTATESYDADEKLHIEFTDIRGLKILDRLVDGDRFNDTYFVYDNLQRLVAVVPPELTAKQPSTQKQWLILGENMNKYGYRYWYNDSMLMTKKKLPGCQPITYQYDGARNLVFSQDGEQRERGEMTFRLYDHSGAPSVTGLCDNTHIVDLSYTWALGDFMGFRSDKGNADSCGIRWVYPINNPRILKATYYHNYDFLNMPPFGNLRKKVTAPSGNRWCMPTGELVAVLGPDGPTGKYITTLTEYDDEERPVANITMNSSGNIETTRSEYALDGLVTSLSHSVKRSNETHTDSYRFRYDHLRRPINTQISIDGGAYLNLVTSEYDAVGRLTSWLPGNEYIVKYAYNTRGQLIKSTSRFLKEILSYTTDTGSPCFNGNISRYAWTTPDLNQCFYDYTYDGFNRLTAAKTSFLQSSKRDYSTAYTYDHNSNLTSITRKGLVLEGEYGTVDDLVIKLDGNRVKKVTDMADEVLLESSMDFHDRADSDEEYTYDLNGNMTSDLNRGITLIRYNALGLPAEVYIDSVLRHTFSYDANGRLLSRIVHKNVTFIDPNPDRPLVPDIPFLPIEPTRPILPTTPGTTETETTTPTTFPNATWYYGSQVYDFMKPVRFETEAGYIQSDTLHAYYRDYLGNVRAVSKNRKAVQITHYYPYGLPWAEGRGRELNNRKYSGKELYTDNGYDTYNFEARHYIPALARFATPDPLCENNILESIYSYCAANPVHNVDPLGLDWVKRVKDGITEYYYDRSVKSVDDINPDSGLEYIENGTNVSIYGYNFTFHNEDNGSVYCDGNQLDPKMAYSGKNGGVFRIYGTDDNALNASTLYSNYFGSSYIGPNNPKTYNGTPCYLKASLKRSEELAIQHDKAYDTSKAAGKTDALFNVKPNVIAADFAFAVGNLQNAFSTNDLKEFGTSISAGYLFATISLFKIIFYPGLSPFYSDEKSNN